MDKRNTRTYLNVLLTALVFVLFISNCIDAFASSKERVPVDNPYSFDPNCYIDEVYYNSTEQSSVLRGASELYEKTGVQFRYIKLDIENIETLTSDKDAIRYCLDYIEQNFEDKDYSIIIYSTNYRKYVYGEGEYDYDYVESPTQFYYGSKISSVFDAEGLRVFHEYIDEYVDNVYLKDIDKALEKCAYTLMGGHEKTTAVLSTVSLILLFALILSSILILFVESKISKKQEDLEILNTPIDELTEQYIENIQNKHLDNK